MKDTVTKPYAYDQDRNRAIALPENYKNMFSC